MPPTQRSRNFRLLSVLAFLAALALRSASSISAMAIPPSNLEETVSRLGHKTARPAIVQSANTLATTINTVTITQDTTWTKANSPYLVRYWAHVAAGATLRIEPGVEVQFERSAYMEVAGTVSAAGTATEPIIFTGTSKEPGSWGGLEVYGNEGAPAAATLRYVTVEYGGVFSDEGNLYLKDATATISHSTFRNGGASGILGWSSGVAHISDSTFIGNRRFAVWFVDGGVNPVLRRLTATANGVDGVGLGGSSYLKGHHTWEATGIPYIVQPETMTVDWDATLQIEPGVEVQFEYSARMEVRGTLTAAGTPREPIIFTGTQRQPNSWEGLAIYGSTKAPARAALSYVTVEYGGLPGGGANIYVASGRVAISHSTIRNSAGDGILIWSNDAGSVIETSHIIGNTGFGLRTNPGQSVRAANNWWDSASGPTVNSGCNPLGTGAQVSADVAFLPFLSGPNLDPGDLAPGDARILSIMPQRWFAPADGTTRVFAKITLLDGKGEPLPGRKVRLRSTAGRVTDGGITDVQGQTLAYVTSTTQGDAELTATLDRDNACEFATSPSARVTFTNQGALGDLFTDSAAPYLSNGIQIDPMPITRGVPTRLRANLTNPNSFPIVVDGMFGVAQLGIGLTFGPLGEVLNKVIPANSTESIEVLWTPVVSGSYCIQFEYSARSTQGLTLMSAPPMRSQRNIKAAPGPLLGPQQKNAIQQASKATDLIDDGSFVVDVLSDPREPVGAFTTFIPGIGVDNILDFIFENGAGINCALVGGSQCKGWNGPRMHWPLADSIGSLMDDPPRQDYQLLATVEKMTFPPAQPVEGMPAARAAALNGLAEASLDLTAKLMVSVVSYDRYAGAAAAGNLQWSSLQTAAYLQYLKESGTAMIAVADKLDALGQEVRSEGFADVVVSLDAYRAYQDRLRTQGFLPEEITAAKLVGLTDAGIESARQRRLGIEPDNVAGSQLQAWPQVSAAFRNAGRLILALPAFGGDGVSAAGAYRTQEVSYNGHRLVRLFESTETIQIGNPMDQRATISLSVRPVDLPADWVVTVTPRAVTLGPGEQQPVTVSIEPGSAVVQGTQPRVAIEGHVGTELVGGVALDVMVPYAATFGGELVLVGPPPDATTPSFGPTLTWNLPAGTTQYHLQVIPTNGDGPGINVIRNAEDQFAIPAPPVWYGLLPDMSYTWRVQATSKATFSPADDPSWGPWAERRFRTPKVSSETITGLSPAQGARTTSLTPTLQWRNSRSDIYYYEVQVSRDQSFNAEPATATAAVYWELRHGGATNPPDSYTIPGSYPLEPSSIYYWRVRPRIQGDGTPLAWSNVFSFTTGP